MIISIASQKGGTGKTTTSVTLAAGLARRGMSILLIDIDSQANSSKVLLPNYTDISKHDTVYRTILNRQPLPIHDTRVPNLAITPSHILLSDSDIELTVAKDHREARLKRELRAVVSDFDHVIIDCPPTLSWLTLNSFTASDGVVVVVSPGYFELDSLVQLSKTIAEVSELYNPDIELLGFLFTMSDPTINSRTSLKVLRQTYTEQVFRTVIPRNTDIRDAHFDKMDVFEYKPDAKAALAYSAWIDELAERGIL